MKQITDILDEKKIDAALASVAEPGTFEYKSFFQISGITCLTPEQICEFFSLLDRNGSEYLGSADLTLFLRTIKPDARVLEEEEVNKMMEKGDPNKQNMIGPNEFQAMVKSTKSQN
ncbi:parvalbumin beta-like [Leptodactylus fuscus]|uniref:parvalbumin beta-like n=1 Tax=Leptodactylus fuscus TaxID=238119 RepID=UPI003F4EB30C